ncbi:MAG: hypothetical protein A3I32_02580 [Candidatus Yanofskybacteria bacterium RIFCSPLOWO2_02_FULL_45_10]|uniref:Uncharacterized protein n=3 Tax=Patescibacteria group TaxID=1783273 RepID=A0A1F8G2J7_9BACT|nr:MAG: hypothetical protein UU67_C0001G0011 [Candidatus Daviesbacteria bacterium GW2011_GWB1_41_5]OGN19545.1 MAG: hypothetical protein A3F25_00375 [Candidatus Yanofskybacteria bacterium RIFCSPHIGHO2_12_FULL_45_19b]OGN32260.1 MAG: hypothetical protein A3I32_02580 [Candidatus Yanofskybacteria bacterium RIFCSPLOWO2_02_FULL_45_10]
MSKKSILKGNYTVANPVRVTKDEETTLTEKMQTAAARALGGSACYIKKANPVWRPPKKEKQDGE